jgi:hypothetical protein
VAGGAKGGLIGDLQAGADQYKKRQQGDARKNNASPPNPGAFQFLVRRSPISHSFFFHSNLPLKKSVCILSIRHGACTTCATLL